MQPDPYERFWQQLHEVRDKQPGKKFSVWPPQAQEGTGVAPDYVYETGKVLCRSGAAELVRSRLNLSADRTTPLPGDLVLLTLPEGDDVHAQIQVANAGSRSGQEGTAPNHLVGITPVNICPADEPVPVAADAQPWPPPVANSMAGAGVNILVIDTGIIKDLFEDDTYRARHPWLHGVMPPPPGKPDTVKRDDSFEILRSGRSPGTLTDDRNTVSKTNPVEVIDGIRVIKEYAGHGTFVSGVIGCVAPGARIQMHHALEKGGALLETELGDILVQVLAEYAMEYEGRWPHIISLSAGSPTMGGRPLMGFDQFFIELDKHPGTVLIAAAGNDARRDDVDGRFDPQTYHFQPAAKAATNDGVISVGALRRRYNGRACFTNYGSSVSVYARGEEHVNAFLHGEYEYHHGLDPHCHNYDPPLYCPCSCVTSLPYHGHAVFQGMARWSGTSFATPLVAGMVAAHLAAHPELGSARRAAHDLITQQAPAITDVDGEPIRAFL